MKLYIIPFSLLLVSCKRPFNPDLDTVNRPLVVEGLVTNAANPYAVKLYRALQYNSNKKYTSVSQANVKVVDDLGHTYGFDEKDPGIYLSNPAEFVGEEGRTYTLTIETSDHQIFKSNLQTLLSNDFNVTTYVEFDSKDVLSTDVYGRISKETVQGVDLLVDIENNLDSLPHFRFAHKSYREYYYLYVVMGNEYKNYCWKTLDDNDLVNITDGKYQTTSKNIEKHPVCFLPTTNEFIYYILPGTKQLVTEKMDVRQQVTKVTRYRINNETFQFYKDINRLLAADGKMFDPIAFQIKGNMQCVSNPQIPVLGFFEASSVDTSYYAVKPGRKVAVKVESYEPPSPADCSINIVPKFWIN